VAEQDAVCKSGTELRPRMRVHPFMDDDRTARRGLSVAMFEPPLAKSLRRRDDRHEADHADEDDRALNDAKSDMPIATLSWMRLAMR
jgi:hypothetical protein